jgi:hypothetical protein
MSEDIIEPAINKTTLTLANLISAASSFCQQTHFYPEIYGATDGKAVGTFIEHKFRDKLDAQYLVQLGNSALGIDLPSLETDIKATSARQPQSSSPFRSARQKIYGLGYNLLVFVYNKQDDSQNSAAKLEFVKYTFIDKNRTADYQTTRGLLEILKRDGNQEDIIAFLADRNLPGDEAVYNGLAEEILQKPPELGYLTISNALQWRLQYGRVVNLEEVIEGITKVI